VGIDRGISKLHFRDLTDPCYLRADLALAMAGHTSNEVSRAHKYINLGPLLTARGRLVFSHSHILLHFGDRTAKPWHCD
jgi:hypothetical protein